MDWCCRRGRAWWRRYGPAPRTSGRAAAPAAFVFPAIRTRAARAARAAHGGRCRSARGHRRVARPDERPRFSRTGCGAWLAAFDVGRHLGRLPNRRQAALVPCHAHPARLCSSQGGLHDDAPQPDLAPDTDAKRRRECRARPDARRWHKMPPAGRTIRSAWSFPIRRAVRPTCCSASSPSGSRTSSVSPSWSRTSPAPPAISGSIRSRRARRTATPSAAPPSGISRSTSS